LLLRQEYSQRLCCWAKLFIAGGGVVVVVLLVVDDSFFREFDATKLDHTKKLIPPQKRGTSNDRKSDPPQGRRGLTLDHRAS